MATIRTIYLPDEINERLKLEENASGLIVELLTKHFNIKAEQKKNLEDREKEIEEARENYMLKYEREKEELLEKLRYKRANELTEEQKIERKKNQTLEKIQSIQEFVKYLIGREFTDLELHEYLIGTESGTYKNIASFLEEKGIELKKD